MLLSPSAPGRHLWLFIVAALAVAAFVVGGAVEHARQRVTRPGAPTGLRASATTCVPPDCEAIRPTVTLTWTLARTGGPAARFVILRDGTQIGEQGVLSPGTVRFVDETVTAGDHHTYAVRASNAKGRAVSATVGVTLPLPPLAVARLDGSYRVRLVVRRAVNLASLEGIAHPERGSRGTSVWLFTSSCRAAAPRCSTRWRGHVGAISPQRLVWAGTVNGRRAACLGGATARAPVHLRLTVRAGAMVDGVWVVSRFSGASSVGFHCAGFAPSHGSVQVAGLRR